MEKIDGIYYMKACDADFPGRLHNIGDLYSLIERIGFLPLFACDIPGFSVEEYVTAECWWTGDEETDPWAWREIACRSDDIAYGKFFDKKSGFIHKDWFAAFANYRRDGYDFDALFEDELASYRAKKIMDSFSLDDEAVGQTLHSPDLKDIAGFSKRPDGGKAEKGFEGAITGLMMQTYLIMSDFKQRKNKRGEDYGWSLAVYETPETKWGYEYVTSCYKEKPEDSFLKISTHLREVLPDADIKEEAIQKVLGIRHSGKDVAPERKTVKKKEAKPKKKKPVKLSYPENLITEVMKKHRANFSYKPLNDDQLRGLDHALDTLYEREKDMLIKRYKEHMTFNAIGKEYDLSPERTRQIVKKALRKLCHPTRRRYFTEGLKAASNWREIAKKRAEEGKPITPDLEIDEILELLGDDAALDIKSLDLSARSYNCLERSGIDNLLELVETVYSYPGAIRRLRNLGQKSAVEIQGRLNAFGIVVPDEYIANPKPEDIRKAHPDEYGLAYLLAADFLDWMAYDEQLWKSLEDIDEDDPGEKRSSDPEDTGADDTAEG